jgi:hypothetical protein
LTDRIAHSFSTIENLLLNWEEKDRKNQLTQQFNQLNNLMKSFFTTLDSFPEVKQRYKENLVKFLHFSKLFVNHKNSECEEEKLKSFVSTLKELLWWFELFHLKLSIKENVSSDSLEDLQFTKFTNKSYLSGHEYVGKKKFLLFHFLFIYLFLFLFLIIFYLFLILFLILFFILFYFFKFLI